MRFANKLLWIAAGILALSLAGCNLFGPQPLPVPSSTPVPPTATPTLLPSATHTPTPTPSPTLTRIQVIPATLRSPHWLEFRNFNAVNDLAFAADGSAWTVSERDVVHWDATTGEGVPYPVPAGNAFLSSLAIDSHGGLWVGSVNGVLQFDGTQWITHTVSTQSTASYPIWTLAIGPDGQVWAANGGKNVFHFDGKAWIEEKVPGDEEEREIYKLIVTPNGEVWAQSFSNIYRFDGTQWTTYSRNQIGMGGGYLPLAVGPDNSIWVGMMGVREGEEGMAHFDGQTWTLYQEMDGPGTNLLTDITVSPDGSVWCSTWDRGVLHFDGQQWRLYTVADGLPGNDIQVVATAPDGSVWAGSLAGLARFDGQRWQIFQANSLAGSPTSITQSQTDGSAWFGTYAGGISHFDGSRWVNYTRADGLNSNSIQAVAVARNGEVWAATDLGSLLKLDGQRWRLFAENIGGHRNEIWALASSEDGTLWLATSQGILRLNGLDKTALFAEDGSVPLNGKDRAVFLPEQQFNSIQVSVDGAVWASTNPGEIYRYDGQSWQVVLKTERGRVYASPAGSVWIADGEELSQIQNGQRLIYDFSPGSIQSLFIARDGTVWVVLERWGTDYATVLSFDGQEWVKYNFTHIEEAYSTPLSPNSLSTVWLNIGNQLMAVENP